MTGSSDGVVVAAWSVSSPPWLMSFVRPARVVDTTPAGTSRQRIRSAVFTPRVRGRSGTSSAETIARMPFIISTTIPSGDTELRPARRRDAARERKPRADDYASFRVADDAHRREMMMDPAATLFDECATVTRRSRRARTREGDSGEG